MLKCIPVINLSNLKYVARAGALLVCKKVGVKTDHTLNKKKTILEAEKRKGYGCFEERFK